MVSRRASWPYRAAAIVLLTGTIAMNVVAKLGPLADWSAAVDVGVNLVLIAGALAAVVVGERKDRSARQSDLDNDY